MPNTHRLAVPGNRITIYTSDLEKNYDTTRSDIQSFKLFRGKEEKRIETGIFKGLSILSSPFSFNPFKY